MSLKDFYCYPNGRLAMSKFWANVAYATGTWIVVKMTIDSKMTYEILLVYLAAVGGAEVAKKLIETKYKEKVDV